jgi:hypothetical protein
MKTECEIYRRDGQAISSTSTYQGEVCCGLKEISIRNEAEILKYPSILPTGVLLFTAMLGKTRLIYRDIQKSVANRIFDLAYELAVATPPNHHSSNTTLL